MFITRTLVYYVGILKFDLIKYIPFFFQVEFMTTFGCQYVTVF